MVNCKGLACGCQFRCCATIAWRAADKRSHGDSAGELRTRTAHQPRGAAWSARLQGGVLLLRRQRQGTRGPESPPEPASPPAQEAPLAHRLPPSRAAVVEVWTVRSTQRFECLSAQTLLGMPGAEVLIPWFGSSHCRCETHLVFFSALPSLRVFCGRLRLLNPGVPFFTGTLHSSAASYPFHPLSLLPVHGCYIYNGIWTRRHWRDEAGNLERGAPCEPGKTVL